MKKVIGLLFIISLMVSVNAYAIDDAQLDATVVDLGETNGVWVGNMTFTASYINGTDTWGIHGYTTPRLSTGQACMSGKQNFQIESLLATNVTGSDTYITVHLVPSGGSASTANTIIYQRTVPAKTGVTVFDKEHLGLLQPGMTLQALCGVNDAINMWGHGYDYQGVYS